MALLRVLRRRNYMGNLPISAPYQRPWLPSHTHPFSARLPFSTTSSPSAAHAHLKNSPFTPTPAPDPPLSSPSQPVSLNKSYVPHQCIMYSRSAFSVFINYIYTEFKEPLRATRIITKKKTNLCLLGPTPCPLIPAPQGQQLFLLIIKATVLTQKKNLHLYYKVLLFLCY